MAEQFGFRYRPNYTPKPWGAKAEDLHDQLNVLRKVAPDTSASTAPKRQDHLQTRHGLRGSKTQSM